MLRFFIDSSVLFSAAYSYRGYSADLLKEALHAGIILVISDFVLEETRRNLAYADITILPAFNRLTTTIPFEIVLPNREDVLAACEVVVRKDAPIVAAAKIGQVDALISLDKKHILNHPEIEKYIRSRVLTPEDAWKLFLSSRG